MVQRKLSKQLDNLQLAETIPILYMNIEYDMVLTTKTITVNLELNGETQNSETLNRIMFTYTLGKDYLSSNMSCSNFFLTAEEREFFTPSSSSLEYSPPRPFMYMYTPILDLNT